MRPVRLIALVTLVAGLLTPVPAQSAVEIPASFTFAGAGWGHGVGMSQYGARGMAAEGRTESEIIQHFYPGTTLSPVRDDMDIRVNLLFQVPSALIRLTGSSESVLQVFAGDIKQAAATPVASMGLGQSLNLAVDGALVLASIGSKDVTTRIEPGTAFTIRWSGTRFLPGVDSWARVGTNASAPLYRYGQLVVRTVKTETGTALVLNNDVRLHDEYLRGIAEMPSSWPIAALKSQVIAARSYALSRYGNGRTTSACDCHVYDSTKDQRFAGWAKEAEANWGQRWALAVSETAPDPLNGMAVVADGKPVTAYFFSSSGGRTQDVSEVWGSRIRWLVSVPDPWSLDPKINPTYAAWSREISQAVMAKAFALNDVISVAFPLRTAGGGVRSAVATSSTGATATLTGEIFRSRTQLPSTYLMRTLSRIEGKSAAAIAVAANRAARPTGTTAILSDDGALDLPAAVAAAGLAALRGQPHLLLDGALLPKVTVDELVRRKITNVTIIGARPNSSVASALRVLKIKVARIATPVATAQVIAARSGAPIIISSFDADVVGAILGLTTRLERPLLLVGADGLTDADRAVLAKTGDLPITLLGRRSALPREVVDELGLTRIVLDLRSGSGESAVAAAAAELDPAAIRVLIAAETSDAVAASALQQPVLWVVMEQEIATATSEWIRQRPRLVQISLLGSMLPPQLLSALRALG